MVFKAGVIYFMLSLSVVLGGYNKDTKIAKTELEFKTLETVLVTGSEEKAIKLVPEVMDIIIENQKDLVDTPHLIEYEITSSNIIVIFDPKYFEDPNNSL